MMMDAVLMTGETVTVLVGRGVLVGGGGGKGRGRTELGSCASILGKVLMREWVSQRGRGPPRERLAHCIECRMGVGAMHVRSKLNSEFGQVKSSTDSLFYFLPQCRLGNLGIPPRILGICTSRSLSSRNGGICSLRTFGCCR
jgi:hypothetical protein